jgi:hypothetical protein
MEEEEDRQIEKEEARKVGKKKKENMHVKDRKLGRQKENNK